MGTGSVGEGDVLDGAGDGEGAVVGRGAVGGAGDGEAALGGLDRRRGPVGAGAGDEAEVGLGAVGGRARARGVEVVARVLDLEGVELVADLVVGEEQVGWRRRCRRR